MRTNVLFLHAGQFIQSCRIHLPISLHILVPYNRAKCFNVAFPKIASHVKLWMPRNAHASECRECRHKPTRDVKLESHFANIKN